MATASSDTAVRFDRELEVLLRGLRDGARTSADELSERANVLVESCGSLVAAAFDHEGAEALDQAHRALWKLYASAVWDAPSAGDPAGIRQTSLTHIRARLEEGFRQQLSSRRPVLEPPVNGSDLLPAWFEELALGDPSPDETAAGELVRDRVALGQLREIVAQRSLFFLREPDPWIYAVPTLQGIAKAGLIDLLLDEYGWGKLDRMHSTIYANLMRALGLEDATDHYLEHASWQYIATLNHQWMLALDARRSRQLLGVVYLTEAGSPNAMRNYLAAWGRLEIDSPAVREFYELHVHADENHRDVALQEVVMPVCTEEPGAALEIAHGIVDARALEAEFAAHLVDCFDRDETSLTSLLEEVTG